jgi:hypothetical protein
MVVAEKDTLRDKNVERGSTLPQLRRYRSFWVAKESREYFERHEHP